jgi:hypothetical protein
MVHARPRRHRHGRRPDRAKEAIVRTRTRLFVAYTSAFQIQQLLGADMNIDRWLGVSGLLIGLIGLLFAYYFYIKTIRTKVLAIAYTKPIPLILPMKEIRVSYRGTTQKALSRVFVLLWNKGTSAIEASDFIGPITLRGGESILLLKIYDKDAAATATVDPENKSISISLLRPGEALILQIDAADDAFKPDLSVAMKSSDMSVFLRMDRAIIPLFGAAFLVAVTISSLLIAVEGHHDWVPADDWWLAVVNIMFLIFTIVISLFVGVVTYFLTRRIIFGGTVPSVALRFFQMQNSVSNALETWKSLRKQIEGATQKQ